MYATSYKKKKKHKHWMIKRLPRNKFYTYNKKLISRHNQIQPLNPKLKALLLYIVIMNIGEKHSITTIVFYFYFLSTMLRRE